MPYIVGQSDIEARYTAERVAQLFSVQASDGSSTGVADATAVAAAISDAEAEIHEILGGAFDVPFTGTIDATLVEVACDLVPWKGMRRRPEYWVTVGGKDVVGAYKLLHDEAVGRLREIRDGKRRISATRIGKNVGGQVVNSAPSAAQPFYFNPDPDVPNTGGFSSGGF